MDDAFHSFSSEHGLVTAEFAVALPAVLALLVLGLSAVSAQVQAARLQQIAAVAAHASARSEPETELASWLKLQAPGAVLETSNVDGVLCATVRQSVKLLIGLEAWQLSETSCAWIGRGVADG